MTENTQYPGANELIVVMEPGINITGTLEHTTAATTVEASEVATVLENYSARISPLFASVQEERSEAPPASLSQGEVEAEDGLPTPEQFFHVVSEVSDLEEVAAGLRGLSGVEAAYVKPAAVPAEFNDMTAISASDTHFATPDFSDRQGYLADAPEGIGISAASKIPGGRGEGVNVTDIEGSWRFTHEDLLANASGVVGGTPIDDLGWRNHGTAVLGVIGGDANEFGVTGIAPATDLSAVSIFPTRQMGSSRAIDTAARKLKRGDIMLIELHRPGPKATGAGQHGFIALEWWPDDFIALRQATRKGIIVVEAAGNGAQNLDDPVYDNALAAFPPWWRNPFRREGGYDSGAVLVGAGAPPPGTHGNNHGPDRSRLGFSNYGACVDAQGWGREVTTCGYGNLQGGNDEDRWYSDSFSGTSSASPIVVGSLAVAQGILKHKGALLTPALARDVLRATGSPQTAASGRPASQRIGNRPDLAQIIPYLLRTS